jgi:hypothetical protein
MSCDLLPSEVGGPHFEGDVEEVLDYGWDLMIAHPPCTYLTCSAEWAYKDKQTKNIRPETLIGAARRAAREEALVFVRTLLEAPIPRIALENPVGVISTRIRPATQYIQPYQFGHDASKRTGLWLSRLPPLRPTKFVEPRLVCCGLELAEGVGRYGCPNCLGDETPRPRWANQTNSGQNRLGPSEDRWQKRSKTYKGIGEAMAEQWGNLTGRRI